MGLLEKYIISFDFVSSIVPHTKHHLLELDEKILSTLFSRQLLKDEEK